MSGILLAAADSTALDLLRRIVGAEPSFAVVGEARDVTTAARMARALRPDVLVVDDSLDTAAADPIRVLARRVQGVALVVTSVDPARRDDALTAGAWGFALRDDAGASELHRTLHAAAEASALCAGAVGLPPVWRRTVGILATTGAASAADLDAVLEERAVDDPVWRALTRAASAESVADAAARASRTIRASLAPHARVGGPIHPHEWRLVASQSVDPVDRAAGRRLPEALCRERAVVLMGVWRRTGLLAMADPFDETTRATAEEHTGLRLRVATATDAEISAALDRVWAEAPRPDAHHLPKPERERMALGAVLGSVLAWVLLLAFFFTEDIELATLPVFFALACGSLLLLYAGKYYVAIAAVVGASTRRNGGQRPPRIHLTPTRQPFVSIHVALYNESRVVERLLRACTSLDYTSYEVIVADDSTDETVALLEPWRSHPRVRVLHRDERTGFKGGALQNALRWTDPRAEYVLVLDADFVPEPGILWEFLAYFSARDDRRLAAVQGYQWHVLNAGENWVAKGVRVEFAGSYVLERTSQELFGTMKMIAGSVYMIRADVLRTFGWSTSITEDWELTIRLYLGGYRVLYTPYIQAPAECVATLRQLIRQRMRWAEGHTFNVKKYWLAVFLSGRISVRAKLEFLYYATYYLQATLFTAGTLAWLIGIYLLGGRLDAWDERLGWSLVLTNLLALPLMNTIGLLLEGSLRRDGFGVLSALALSYIVAPFQGLAALRGLLELEEGHWHRTRKSGRITERLSAFDLTRVLPWELPRPPARRRAGGIATLALAIAVGIFLMGVLSIRALAGVRT